MDFNWNMPAPTALPEPADPAPTPAAIRAETKTGKKKRGTRPGATHTIEVALKYGALEETVKQTARAFTGTKTDIAAVAALLNHGTKHSVALKIVEQVQAGETEMDRFLTLLGGTEKNPALLKNIRALLAALNIDDVPAGTTYSALQELAETINRADLSTLTPILELTR